MLYKKEDVDDLIRKYGLHFSDADRALAEKNPDAGMSLVTHKRDFARAKTQEERDTAHRNAEKIRSDYGNYSAGKDGSGFYIDEPTPGSFEYDKFENPYKIPYAKAIGDMVYREPWQYNPDQDMAWQTARKQYLREANRATQDTLGKASTMTGGMPSTAAISAASQAGNYYRSQMNDRLGDYMDRDYQRYMDDIGLKFDTVSALKSLKQDERADYDADRNFGYNQLTDDLGYRSEREDTEYNRDRQKEQDEYNRAWQEAQDKYNKETHRNEYNDALQFDMIDTYMQMYEATQDRTYRQKALELLEKLKDKNNTKDEPKSN